MRLNQFEMIVALEDCNSLSEVSEKLYISQPSISKAIRELEEEVGYAILTRTKNGVKFTELGNQVLQYAKEIMERIEKIKQLNLVRNEMLEGKVSLGVTRFWGSDIFSRVMVGLKEQYPNLTIQFHEGYSKDILDDVKMENLDFGIIMMYSTDETVTMQKITEYGLKYELLFRDVVNLYACNKHILHQKTNLLMKDVVQYSYVTGGSAYVADFTKQLLESYGYQKEIEIINNQQLLLRYLTTQQAFTSMPEQIFQESLEHQRYLKQLPVRDLDWTCQIGIVYRPRVWNPLEAVVLERLHQRLKV